MKRYPSKISYGLLIFVLAVIGYSIVISISHANWTGIGISLLTLIFVFYVFFSVYYVIEGNNLVIRVGILFKWKIEISTIKIIAESNSWISAPAASLDRLKISYNNHHNIVVSPKDKEGFIRELIRINPGIRAGIS